MSELAKKKCIPCQGGMPPLTAEEMKPLLAQLEEWKVVEDHHLKRAFELDNFAEALDMVNRIGVVAEAQDHHPDLFLAWGKVEVTLFTHKINGLTESDFIMAAKIDLIHKGMKLAKR